ncbi:alpha-amylase 3, chloroplastic isoform X2 [Impatiens glandulifera]|uniref:alpha-amylase 3, chloroplastic isoform X2 n=1 Tax=Impatiens glandulifera TaxID=253017 RepID=UPI001FB13F9C|nr:alpha-amylase 3, chloroplastic isoform X2 [Impatiens glandulifera]
MATVPLESLHHHHSHRIDYSNSRLNLNKAKRFSFNCTTRRPFPSRAGFCNFIPSQRTFLVKAVSTDSALLNTATETAADIVFQETFPLKRTDKVEGKIFIRLVNGNDQNNWKLVIGCNIPGKWILHWGVNFAEDVGSEWDQPPVEMRPPGSVPIKGYAIETPLKETSDEGRVLHEVTIDFNINTEISSIKFVLKDEETGTWCQYKGRDFKVALFDYADEDSNTIGGENGLNAWPGALGKVSNMLLGSEQDQPLDESGSGNAIKQIRRLGGFNEEYTILKEVTVQNKVDVSMRKCRDTAKNILYLETDLPGDVLVHWGICRNDSKKWEIPADPYPLDTKVFKKKALQTLLKRRKGRDGSSGTFSLDEGYTGFMFVLKLSDGTWLNCKGNDFYIPLPSSSVRTQTVNLSEGVVEESVSYIEGVVEESDPYTDGIINEIRSLVTDISSEKGGIMKSKEAQESILHEIEKLAAEAYKNFRSSTPTFSETDVLEPEVLKPPVNISSGTGSGFEILLQGFNWESHKSGKWYIDLKEKASEISSLGFTVVWLPPPTESVSPEGYMPKDLYNLNSRYGNIEELKLLVTRFHKSGVKVLGDVVLNHRCAHYKNANGIWNLFGGRLNWDDRAIVADDPHFQGKGNKSSGDNFHAAPNIDHSQDFVRKDIKEWLCWLREEIGYDGWRLDFVRGFWGGYVKDYLDASGPYFAVGEYWDSLSYTFGEMDHNQDTHRQRIIDWINATNGTAGAFDVTTKGILHATLDRCEYWRLSDQKGKPPGVVGWWPSRAVTFIENHDTGSTQGHWRFPGGKEMQGYAYILTHPGTPAVFYDHIFSHMQSEIAALISLRNRNKINCRSTVNIVKAERDVYAALIDDKLAMKMGPGHYEPSGKWSLVLEGNDYKVWEEKS